MELSLVVPDDMKAIMAEYQRIWPLMRLLHTAVAKLARSDAPLACAKRLKMLSKNGGRKVITFVNEAEADIFQDYLVYMFRPRGINLVQQMVNRRRYPPESDESQLLQGMAQARFSVFLVQRVIPGSGFFAMDSISGEQVLILDQSIERMGGVGLLLGLRIFPLRQVWMHTGACLVLGRATAVEKFEPAGIAMNSKQEQELNEKALFKWRQIADEMEGHS